MSLGSTDATLARALNDLVVASGTKALEARLRAHGNPDGGHHQPRHGSAGHLVAQARQLAGYRLPES